MLTDKNGSCSKSIPLGSYRLTITAEGYALFDKPFEVNAKTMPYLCVTMIKENAAAVKTRLIRFSVTDDSSHPVAGASIRLVGDRVGYTKLTDEKGSCSQTVESGSSGLAISAEGYEPFKKALEVVGSRSEQQEQIRLTKKGTSDK